MKIEIMNYNNKKVTKDVGNIDTIARINIIVISGDETLEVVYKDYTIQLFHSDFRSHDYYDGKYEIYSENGNKLVFSEMWKNRADSYSYWGC